MIKVNLSADPDGMQAEVDASAYMAELRSEVEQSVVVIIFNIYPDFVAEQTPHNIDHTLPEFLFHHARHFHFMLVANRLQPSHMD